jgi:hypothetical protein
MMVCYKSFPEEGTGYGDAAQPIRDAIALTRRRAEINDGLGLNAGEEEMEFSTLKF